jgi:hypothetical protein
MGTGKKLITLLLNNILFMPEQANQLFGLFD